MYGAKLSQEEFEVARGRRSSVPAAPVLNLAVSPWKEKIDRDPRVVMAICHGLARCNHSDRPLVLRRSHNQIKNGGNVFQQEDANLKQLLVPTYIDSVSKAAVSEMFIFVLLF